MNIVAPHASWPAEIDTTGLWCLLPDFFVRSAGFPLALLDDLRCLNTINALDEGKADAAIEEIFTQDRERVSKALLALFEREDVAEAIYVSSPKAYRNALRKAKEALIEGRTDANSRRAIRVAFSYLQRFAAKNETTSYFGPMNYGRVRNDQRAGLTYSETDAAKQRGGGTALLTARRVFLTYWAMRALARSISETSGIVENLPIHPHPLLVREDGKFGIQGGALISESPVLAAALDLVDGERCLEELRVVAGESTAALISRLLQKGLLSRGIQISSTQLETLEGIKADLGRLPPTEARDLWSKRIEDWLDWCAAMAVADFPTRRALINDAESWFVAQTGEAARRGAGQLYEDRAIYYEETRGALTRFDIGQPLHQTLVQRIAPILELAKEQGHYEWQRLQSQARETLDQIAPSSGKVSFLSFVEAMRDVSPPHVADPKPSPAAKRLTSLVGQALEPSCKEVRITSGALGLPCSAPNRSYALADLFIDAACPEEIASGDFQVLVRKLHHALPIPGWLGTMHPERERFASDMADLMRKPGFDRLIALEVQRRNKGFYSFPGPRAVYSEPVLDKTVEAVSAAQLEVRRRGATGVALYLKGQDRPIDLYLTLADHLRFAPFAALTSPWMSIPAVSLGTFTPRISLGGAVMQRATWHFGAKDVATACGGQGVDRLRRVRAWQAAQNLPDRIFAATAEDRKPVFVDLANETSLEIFAAMARGTDAIIIQEMFPDRDGLFLHPHIGGCTSELRIGIANANIGDV